MKLRKIEKLHNNASAAKRALVHAWGALRDARQAYGAAAFEAETFDVGEGLLNSVGEQALALLSEDLDGIQAWAAETRRAEEDDHQQVVLGQEDRTDDAEAEAAWLRAVDAVETLALKMNESLSEIRAIDRTSDTTWTERILEVIDDHKPGQTTLAAVERIGAGWVAPYSAAVEMKKIMDATRPHDEEFEDTLRALLFDDD